MRSVSNKETELGRRFGLLDVYPMSILRPDARRSRRMSRRRECPRERDAERLRALCTAGRAGLVESPAANAAQRTLELRAERVEDRRGLVVASLSPRRPLGVRTLAS